MFYKWAKLFGVCFVVLSSLVTCFAAHVVTAAIRYYNDYMKLNVSYIVL